jgi:3-dehydroquinate dehydratase / shikimate dehydrogenase
MICVPIIGPTMSRALEDIPKASEVADIIELRLDLIDDVNLAELLKAVDKPVIVTNRHKREGGQFKGSEEERVKFLQEAIAAEVDYIDIEAGTSREFLQPILETKCKTKKIISYHHFSLTPESLIDFYETMSETPAEIIKIVTYAKNITDNIIVFNLLRHVQVSGKKLISFCMGEQGEISRILSPIMGGFLTFGSLDTGKESAPGQIPAYVLRDIYRVNMDRPDYKIFGVVGDPVYKSLGYLIHNTAFKKKNLPHIYLPFLVHDMNKFFSAFEPYFEGLSVTMPHKEKVRRLLDMTDGATDTIGAANTVVRERNIWVGYNTDYSGAMKAFGDRCDLKDKKVLIIGSGGTAKAIGYGIVQKGGDLTVTYNQNRERGEALASDLNCRLISSREIGAYSFEVIINCSPVGMTPDVSKTPYPKHMLKPDMVVFDAVYNPLETRLIKDAKEVGCIAIPGVELFVNQAAEQFEKWTGVGAPKEVMRQVVVDKLKSLS